MILNIDLVSDFVCPWCFLGAVRLDRALAELRATRPDIEPRINWLPFFLNPDTPLVGAARPDILARMNWRPV